MNKEQIAALRQLFANQLRERGKIYLNNQKVFENLIECSNDRSFFGKISETLHRLKEVCHTHRVTIPASFIRFDGVKFLFEFHLCNRHEEWTTVQYELRYKLTVEDFAENFAYVYWQTISRLIGRYELFLDKEEV